MTQFDIAGAWLRYQVKAGETALVMRQAGSTWKQIYEELHLADELHAQRAVALFLSADLAARGAHGERAGAAQAAPAADGSPESASAAAAIR